MITRTYQSMSGERKEQELNELSSMLVKFCQKKQDEFESIKDTVEWADGYSTALNEIEAIILGLPAHMVAKNN